MVEIIDWLLFKPFIGFFHAAVMILHPSRSPATGKLKLLIGIALAIAILALTTLTASLWWGGPQSLILASGLMCVVCCYVAGFLASWIEEAGH